MPTKKKSNKKTNTGRKFFVIPVGDAYDDLFDYDVQALETKEEVEQFVEERGEDPMVFEVQVVGAWLVEPRTGTTWTPMK